MKISVITSVYDEQSYLKESIQSILNQSHFDFEFIIIDDGSKGKSHKILLDFASKDSRIRLIHNNKNIGLTKSLNKALKTATGEYIARHDADDVSLPQRLECQLNFLKANPEIFLVGSAVNFIDESDNFIKKSNTIVGARSVARVLSKRNCIYHPTIMFLNKGALYREKFMYAQDYDFYLNLLSQGYALNNLKQILVHRRVRHESIGEKNTIQQSFFARKALEFYRQRQENGKDQYDSFRPKEILILKEDTSSSNSLKTKIWSSFSKRQFVECRHFIRDYSKLKGITVIFILVYALTFLPQSLLEPIIKFFSKRM